MTIELTPEQVAEGWIAHDGGPRPYGITYPIQIMFRDGETTQFTVAREFDWKWAAQRPRLLDYPGGHFADIIAYRPETTS